MLWVVNVKMIIITYLGFSAIEIVIGCFYSKCMLFDQLILPLFRGIFAVVEGVNMSVLFHPLENSIRGNIKGFLMKFWHI